MKPLITVGAAVIFGRWNLMTARLVLMKLVLSAYGVGAVYSSQIQLYP
jgi:hypothetical protein